MGKIPWNTILPSLIPVAGSLISNRIQNQQAWKRWRATNRYNSPAEQIKRLKEAGLSSAMFYSRGQTQPAAVQPDQSRLDPSLGTAEGIQRGQQVRAMNIQEKLANAQLQEIRTRTEGRHIENTIKQKEANRYDQDRDLVNALKVRRDQRETTYLNEIEQKNIEIRETANMIASERLNFDKEKYVLDYQLRQRQQEVLEQDSAVRKQALLIQAARVAIERGYLNVSEERLKIELNKYESDYALWNAIESAADGQINWKSLTKGGATTVGKYAGTILKKFLFKR